MQITKNLDLTYLGPFDRVHLPPWVRVKVERCSSKPHPTCWCCVSFYLYFKNQCEWKLPPHLKLTFVSTCHHSELRNLFIWYDTLAYEGVAATHFALEISRLMDISPGWSVLISSTPGARNALDWSCLDRLASDVPREEHTTPFLCWSNVLRRSHALGRWPRGPSRLLSHYDNFTRTSYVVWRNFLLLVNTLKKVWVHLALWPSSHDNWRKIPTRSTSMKAPFGLF